MNNTDNYFDSVLLETGKAFKKMKEDGKTYAEIRESAYSINSAILQFVAEVLNKEDPDCAED